MAGSYFSPNGRLMPYFRSMQDVNETMEVLQENFNSLFKDKDRLEKEVKNYKEVINADVRVQELEAKVKELQDRLLRGFEITESQTEAITEWKIKHEAEKHGLDTFDKRLRAAGSIGDGYTYEFVPTSIGTFGCCVCGKCGEKFVFQEAF